jgi:hypothetical protein
MNVRRILAPVVFAIALFTLDIPFVAAQCRWDGTAPFCNGQCGNNETEKARLDSIPDFWVPPYTNQNPPFGANCVFGTTKALCCSTPGISCRWAGTAPLCNGSCQAGETKSPPPEGSSSGASCWTGSKVYCCKYSDSNIYSSHPPLIGKALDPNQNPTQIAPPLVETATLNPPKKGGPSAIAMGVLGGLVAVWIIIVVFRRQSLFLVQARR